jgi:hypothetical protein
MVLFVGLGSIAFGFNNFIVGMVQDLDSFYQYFDLSLIGLRASYTTSINGSKELALHDKLGG